MSSTLLRLLPQPGQVFGLYPPGFQENFPSILILSLGVDRSGEKELVRIKSYPALGDNPDRGAAAFGLVEGLAAESLSLDHFDDLFRVQRVLKIEETASGVAG